METWRTRKSRRMAKAALERTIEKLTIELEAAKGLEVLAIADRLEALIGRMDKVAARKREEKGKPTPPPATPRPPRMDASLRAELIERGILLDECDIAEGIVGGKAAH